MFQVFCPDHQARVLLSTGRIEAIRNTAGGVVVEWRCWCDHRGRSLGGRTVPDRLPAAS
jgi:hypothetical protein